MTTVYCLTDGPMEIDSVTGEVRVKTTFDFEGEHFYSVTVTAYDQVTPSLNTTAAIVLTIEPKNEFDPVWTSGTDFTVAEDTPPGGYASDTPPHPSPEKGKLKKQIDKIKIINNK